jgi:hypothetical protein
MWWEEMTWLEGTIFSYLRKVLIGIYIAMPIDVKNIQNLGHFKPNA